jgi:hypothetical protein
VYDPSGVPGGNRLEISGTNANLWIEDRLSLGIQPVTIADDTVGASQPTDTTAPTSAIVQVTCNDGDGCNYNFGEGSASVGDILIIINVGANAVDIDEAGDIRNLSADPVTLGTDDTITLVYSDQADDEWVQISTSNN